MKWPFYSLCIYFVVFRLPPQHCLLLIVCVIISFHPRTLAGVQRLTRSPVEELQVGWCLIALPSTQQMSIKDDKF